MKYPYRLSIEKPGKMLFNPLTPKVNFNPVCLAFSDGENSKGGEFAPALSFISHLVYL